MSMPSPFEIGGAIGQNISGAFAQHLDRRAIDEILQQAQQSNDPNTLDDSLRQILTQVSPQGQQGAQQVLLHQQAQQQARQEKQRRDLAYRAAGLDPDIDPGIQREMIKSQRPNAANKSLEGAKNALSRLEGMIGKPGIGFGSGLNPSDKARHNRGEFQTLQAGILPIFKSLFPRGMTEKEFKFIQDNYIPQYGETDAKIQGKIDGLKSMLAEQGGGLMPSSAPKESTFFNPQINSQERPPLTSFYR